MLFSDRLFDVGGISSNAPRVAGEKMKQVSDEDRLATLEAGLRAARHEEAKPAPANHEKGSETAFRMVGLLVGPILIAVAVAWILDQYWGGGRESAWLWILAPFLGLGLGIYGVIGEGRRLTRLAQLQEKDALSAPRPAAPGLAAFGLAIPGREGADDQPQEQALPSGANAVSGQRREHADGAPRDDDADDDD